MASAPPSYDEAITHPSHIPNVTTGPDYTYVDFAPVCTESRGFFAIPKFEQFSILVNRANDWLRSNGNFVVEGCETLGVATQMTDQRGCIANTQISRYYIHVQTRQHGVGGDHNRRHTERILSMQIIKCLRLYLRRKMANESPEPSQIGYLNVSPHLIEPSGFFHQAKYDSYNETVNKFNEFLSKNPINGRIISIEAVTIDRENNIIDDDGSYLRTSTHQTSHLSTMLRLFYLSGQPAYERIGSADFQPDILSTGGIFSTHNFAGFSQTMEKVRNWVTTQAGIRITNIQTIPIHYEKALKPEISDRIDYMTSKFSLRMYFNLIRVFYVTSPSMQMVKPVNLSCKVFVPQMTVRRMIGQNEYETFDVLFKREIGPFINYNSNSKVLNFEIVPMGSKGNFDTMMTDRSHFHELIATARVYFDGSIQEPPLGVIEPRTPPREETVECCVIL